MAGFRLGTPYDVCVLDRVHYGRFQGRRRSSRADFRCSPIECMRQTFPSYERDGDNELTISGACWYSLTSGYCLLSFDPLSWTLKSGSVALRQSLREEDVAADKCTTERPLTVAELARTKSSDEKGISDAGTAANSIRDMVA